MVFRNCCRFDVAVNGMEVILNMHDFYFEQDGRYSFVSHFREMLTSIVDIVFYYTPSLNENITFFLGSKAMVSR